MSTLENGIKFYNFRFFKHHIILYQFYQYQPRSEKVLKKYMSIFQTPVFLWVFYWKNKFY